MNAAESMRHEWNERARKDAFFYIASWRKDWDLTDFLRSGNEDYERLVAPVLKSHGFVPDTKFMLEVGCGAGRMSHAFASHFAQVFALDISEEMLGRARELHGKAKNISWVRGNGTDLQPMANDSVDFVFSYLVLQHLPAEEIVKSYVREIIRVLKPSGICLFQFHGTRRSMMNWKGRAAWALIDGLWVIRLRALSHFVARLAGFDPQMAGRNWHGTPISAEAMRAWVDSSGAAVLEMQGTDTPLAWCTAQKPV
jgi:ubiquinone/menaquinone biosynthesis C-methylase UbiE